MPMCCTHRGVTGLPGTPRAPQGHQNPDILVRGTGWAGGSQRNTRQTGMENRIDWIDYLYMHVLCCYYQYCCYLLLLLLVLLLLLLLLFLLLFVMLLLLLLFVVIIVIICRYYCYCCYCCYCYYCCIITYLGFHAVIPPFPFHTGRAFGTEAGRRWLLCRIRHHSKEKPRVYNF